MKRHLLLTGCLFLIYALLFWGFAGSAEMTGDDGLWSELSFRIATGTEFPFFGPINSVGTAQSPLAGYLDALPLLVYKSHYAILTFHLFFLLLGHFYIIKTGEKLIHFTFGVLLSILFFFLPILFTAFTFKTAQVFYLLPVVPALLYYSLDFYKGQSPRSYLYMLLLAAVAPFFHLSALPAPFICLAAALLLKLSMPLKKTAVASLAAAAVFALGLLQSAVPVPIVTALLVLFGLLVGLLNLQKKFSLPTKVLTAVVLGLLALSAASRTPPSLSDLFELLNPMSYNIGHYTGTFDDLFFVDRFSGVQVLLIFIGIPWVVFVRPDKRIRPLVILALLFFAVYRAVDFYFPFSGHPLHWYIVSLPVFCTLMAYFAYRFSKYLLYAMIAVQAGYALSMNFYLKTRGGGGWHGATLESQLEVYSEIYRINANPEISFVNTFELNKAGHEHLLRRYFTSDSSAPRKKFAVYFYDNDKLLPAGAFDRDKTGAQFAALGYRQVPVRKHLIFAEP